MPLVTRSLRAIGGAVEDRRLGTVEPRDVEAVSGAGSESDRLRGRVVVLDVEHRHPRQFSVHRFPADANPGEVNEPPAAYQLRRALSQLLARTFTASAPGPPPS